ncbi:hypothetical protein AVEN_64692-1 [Araneus ventricosus]|uniref:BESS domain-containing protein n=1 Tax=Araneus ventricosus TaxID=182803 RepID=A0A4Y2Q6Y3_ARAVE|nr:hypothetical protein AVEN_64692-1 [Araneus ventricosus]
MATDSDSTLVDSGDENESMLASVNQQPQSPVPKESFNPFLLVPTTSMFGGVSSKEGDLENKVTEDSKKLSCHSFKPVTPKEDVPLRGQFLRDTVAFRKTSNSLVPDVKVCGDIDANVPSTFIDVPEEATKPPPKKDPRNNNHLVGKKIIEVLERNMTGRQEIAKNNQNADRLYLLSLLPTLKSIQPHLILKAKMEILAVLDQFPKINDSNNNNEPQTIEILYLSQSENDLTENIF